MSVSRESRRFISAALHIFKIINVDMFFPCNAVFEVQPVFIGMQVIIRKTYFSAFGYDDGDFIAVYRYNVEYDGIFQRTEIL